MRSELVITSSSNPIIKLARSLHQRKIREESLLFVVEGIHNVGAAVEAGWNIHTLLYSRDLLSSPFANQLIDEQSSAGINCQSILPQLFTRIAEKENPQGLLAIVHQRNILLDELDAMKFQWGVAAISPQDPGNVGTILRTIDCVGADGLILLDGGVDPYHPAIVRASMGSFFSKPVIQASFSAFISWARSNQFTLIGSSAHAEKDYRSLSLFERPAILIIGNEQKGMTPEQTQACDLMISLPMHGQASSLNLSVAASVLLYAMLK
jgi:TrmH family RNA methyltransferase